MNWLTLILQVVSQLGPIIPQVITAWNTPAANTMKQITAVVSNTAVEAQLIQIGAQLFPKLAPEFQAGAALLQIAHPTALQYVQGGLNILAAAKVFTMPATVRNGQLVIDGLWGGQTTAAAEAAEAKAGIKLSGAPNDLLINWIGSKLAQLS